jgi:hypothetical protein
MTATFLNIGLARNDRPSDNLLVEVLAELPNLLISDLRLVRSSTERTLVVGFEIDGEWIDDLATRLCVQFAQDCIAIYRTRSGAGKLVGPKAEAWAPFNPAEFHLPSGLTLAQVQALHADTRHVNATIN